MGTTVRSVGSQARAGAEASAGGVGVRVGGRVRVGGGVRVRVSGAAFPCRMSWDPRKLIVFRQRGPQCQLSRIRRVESPARADTAPAHPCQALVCPPSSAFQIRLPETATVA